LTNLNWASIWVIWLFKNPATLSNWQTGSIEINSCVLSGRGRGKKGRQLL
jgi:hypothetical protein